MEQKIRYGLDARLDPGKTFAYSLQHLILLVANAAIMPLIIARDNIKGWLECGATPKEVDNFIAAQTAPLLALVDSASVF